MVPLMIPALGGKALADSGRGYGYPIDTRELSYPRRSPNDFEREPLASQYIGKIRDRLVWIRETQSENLLEASYAIADTVQAGGTCWYSWDMGHSIDFDIVPGRNGVPEIFTMGYNAQKARKGDLFLNNITGTQEVLEDCRKKGVCLIGAPCAWGMDGGYSDLIVRDSAKFNIRPYSDLWINLDTDTVGAVVQVPGMPAPIGPVSGVVGMVTYWMMVADACRILARRGKSVPVRGDEPSLNGRDIPTVSLRDPLLDDYFENVLLQLDMIRAEMGNIQKIAAMAAEAALSGGKVYGYSFYRSALAVEAETRRGGLALTRGVDESDGRLRTYAGEFEGTSKDLVIMGVFSPDDPADLRNLDRFRASGMKVASIGPMTRDIKVPDGRTVPGEADVHAGLMCDTYGLYALPGFERRICPTSGVMINQLFFAIVMTTVEEIMWRSGGNVPGGFFSAAVRGGTEHMHRMNTWWRERGY